MAGAEQLLLGRESPLEQRDRLSHPACLSVGERQVVLCADGVRMTGAEQTLKLRGQRLADGDGSWHAVAQLDQVMHSERSKLYQHPGQFLVGLRGRWRISQQRHDLAEHLPDRSLIASLHEDLGRGSQGGGGGPERRRQASPLGRLFADHSRHQAVHADDLAVEAEAQQRLFSQPLQGVVHHGRGHPAPAAEQRACLPGGTQQVAANRGRGQHGHELHDPGAHAEPVGSVGGLQGQRRRLSDTRRVGLLAPGWPVPGRQRAQFRQVLRVPQVLAGDHHRGQVQRQRQLRQLGGHGRGAGFVGQAGPPVQHGQCLLSAERVHRADLSPAPSLAHQPR